MGIVLPEKCIRRLDDCQPLALIESDEGNSFVCCGLNDGTRRALEQDKFTYCFKNAEFDEISYYDYQDMKDQLSVLAQALSADQHMKQNKDKG